MSSDRLLSLVSIGGVLVAVVLPVAVFLFRAPSNALARAALAVAVGWASLILYVTFVENPAGVAAGRAAGEHFPESRFDNNTTASAMVAGWMAPLLAVGIVALVKRIRTGKQFR